MLALVSDATEESPTIEDSTNRMRRGMTTSLALDASLSRIEVDIFHTPRSDVFAEEDSRRRPIRNDDAVPSSCGRDPRQPLSTTPVLALIGP